MNEIADLDLGALGEKGYIPGPGEENLTFLNRVTLSEKRCRDPYPFLQKDGMKAFERVPVSTWDLVFTQTKRLIGCTPHWICAVYSNHRLSPWQGAVTWIYEEGASVWSMIQLRRAFKKGTFFFLYSLEEVLLHETLHAVRVAFNEPQFEEIFAFSLSKRRWHRFLGPLFRRPLEVNIFMGTMGVFFLGWSGTLFIYQNVFLSSLFFLLPLTALSVSFIRLVKDQILFYRALKVINQIFLGVFPLAVAMRLTDREMMMFAKDKKEKIKAYISRQSGLRWKQILLNFQLKT